jgi:hypothetical protein
MIERDGKLLFHWIAWSADRGRICDTGHAWGDDVAAATRIAWMCIGGPHMADIVEMQVEAVK